MAEEELKDGVEDVIENEPEAKEPPKVSRADWENRQKERASKSGWKDFDDYIAEGGDPDKWKTADAFNIYGELIGTVRKKEAEFEQRLQGVQQLSQAQLAAQRQQLLAEREELIELGGKAKEVKALERQIDTLNQPIAPPPTTILEEWNAANTWITEDTPKAAYALTQWNKILAEKLPYDQAITKLEAQVRKHFPPTAARTTTIPDSERGNGSKGFGNRSKTVSMDSLTAEEAGIWKHSSSMWGNDQKAFLQSVSDMRKEANGGK